jgi:predicted MPP superfamily phosphohydrolase
MSYSPIRWLHLSDFHVGKDNYGQRRLFKYILDLVSARVDRGDIPDLVFITGDLANKGQLSEYEEFTDNFIYPLADILGDGLLERIFTIPGNHDVDRSKAKSIGRYHVLQSVPEFLDPTNEGIAERSNLFPRFEAFASSDLSNRSGWLRSKEGAFTTILNIKTYKVGILGINTAWFCGGDDDRHQLSPGKSIVEEGLEAIKASDVRIVLGHHPIDWFIDDEGDAIRALLGKNKVIYLHGHLHKNRSRQEEGAGYPFITIQAGASFQAREDEKWVNRLLWCDLNLANRGIEIEPLRWSKDNQEWSLDGTAFPERYRKAGTDRWVLPLLETPLDEEMGKTQKLQLPQGWVHVDIAFLSRYRTMLKTEQVLRYFDGRVPGWAEALSPNIPKRAIVDELVAELTQASQGHELKVTLLTGPGGEGKSTVLRQVVSELALLETGWNIIWHDDPDTPLSSAALTRLPKFEGTWIIVSDDADLIASDIFDSVKTLHSRNRKDFQFLLCCRDTDWIGAKGDQKPWREYASFVEKRLRGLSIQDAEVIVRAWSQYGTQGLGELAKNDVDQQEAARRLVEVARSEQAPQEGAFLGAMLRVRIGEGLHDHIKALLLRLRERPAPGGTLMDAFAYIAILHAENLSLLSKAILAGVLGCKIGDIKRRVTGPLGDEAAVATSGQYIFTRHRAIAEVAVKVLSDDFHIDFEEIYVEMIQTVMQMYASGEFIPNLANWRFLSSHFFDKGNQSFAIRLAQEVHKLDPHDPYLFVQLSRLLREAGQPERSVQLFSTRVVDDLERVYYNEWATAEGSLGNDALAACLAGISLADAENMPSLTRQRAVASLSGLALSFNKLFDKYNNILFIEACGSAAQLALGLDPQATYTLPGPLAGTKRFLNKARQVGVEDADYATALDRLTIGIAAAWKERERELRILLRNGEDLTFHSLARLLRIEDW